MSDVIALPAALAAIRAEIAGLIANIDLGEKPRPKIRLGDGVSPVDREPGAIWELAHKIRVFTVDTPDSSDAVFVTDVQWGWMDKTDWQAFTPTEARQFGMALIAAAEWAEKHRHA